VARVTPTHTQQAEPPDAAAAPAAAPPVAELLARILFVQRTAGNQAAVILARSAILAREPPQATTPETAFDDAVRARRWETAAQALAAMDTAARRGRIDTATTDTLAHVGPAAEAANLAEVRDAVAAKLRDPAHAGRAQQILRDEEFAAAMAVPDWPRVARALNAYDPPEIEGKLAPLTLDQLNDLCAAGRTAGAARMLAPAEAARVRKLGQEWEAAFTSGLWERAVTLVQAYNDIDLPIQLERLDFDKIAALCLQADRMPSYQRTRRAAEPIRVRKLGEAYDAAVNASDWPRGVRLLNTYNDLDLLPRARSIHTKGPAALAAAQTAAAAEWADDNARVRRTLAFLAVEPLTGAAVRPATTSGVTGGTAEPGVAVPGGSVTFSSGATRGTAGNIYGLSYAGTDAAKTGWIQFIARNIERFDATGGSLGFHTGTWTGTGQPARNFSTSAAPAYFLDTLSNQAPFYEAASAAGGQRGASDVSPAQTAMYDAPAGVNAIVAGVFAANPAVKSVKSRAVFDTYLVRDMQVLRHDTITVEFTYTAAPTAGGPQPTPATTHTGGGATDHMPSDRFRAMTARFPTFSYLPHR
jgi:hypothetical protein